MPCHAFLCMSHVTLHESLPLIVQVELHGILPVNDGQFEGLQQSGVRWSNRLRQAAAVCHSLTMVNKTLLAGEPMERSMFKLVEAQFLVRMFTLSVIQETESRTDVLLSVLVT